MAAVEVAIERKRRINRCPKHSGLHLNLPELRLPFTHGIGEWIVVGEIVDS
jgi:hypothetical protein